MSTSLGSDTIAGECQGRAVYKFRNPVVEEFWGGPEGQWGGGVNEQVNNNFVGEKRERHPAHLLIFIGGTSRLARRACRLCRRASEACVFNRYF